MVDPVPEKKVRAARLKGGAAMPLPPSAPAPSAAIASTPIPAAPVAAEPASAAEPATPPAVPPALAAMVPPVAAQAIERGIDEFKEAAPSPAVQSDHSQAEAPVPVANPEDDTEMASSFEQTTTQAADKAATTAEGVTATATAAAQQATDKAQAMFGDMSARFKAALERSQKLGEEMVELAKGNVEAMVASARVAAKGGEAIGQEVGEYGRKSMEAGVAAIKTMASAKSPTELFQLQSDYLKQAFDGAVAEASKLSESMLKVAGEAAQPLSSRYAVAAEKIKSATA